MMCVVCRCLTDTIDVTSRFHWSSEKVSQGHTQIQVVMVRVDLGLNRNNLDFSCLPEGSDSQTEDCVLTTYSKVSCQTCVCDPGHAVVFILLTTSILNHLEKFVFHLMHCHQFGH